MITVKIIGTPEVIKNLEAKKDKLRMSLADAVEYMANLVKNRSKEVYLRGPRPSRLGVVTGNLYKSIRSWKEYDAIKGVLRGKIGTNVWYGKKWETGETPPGKPERFKGPAVTKALREIYKKMGKGPSKRPFLKPALMDLKPAILERLKTAVDKGIR